MKAFLKVALPIGVLTLKVAVGIALFLLMVAIGVFMSLVDFANHTERSRRMRGRHARVMCGPGGVGARGGRRWR